VTVPAASHAARRYPIVCSAIRLDRSKAGHVSARG